MKPTVEPAGPLNVCVKQYGHCANAATLGGDVTYDWTNATTGVTTTTPGNGIHAYRRVATTMLPPNQPTVLLIRHPTP